MLYVQKILSDDAKPLMLTVKIKGEVEGAKKNRRIPVVGDTTAECGTSSRISH